MFSTKEGAARLSIWVVVGLILIKVAVGWLTSSISILAQATDSLLDLVAAVITLSAIRMAAKPADSEHPYGHGKMEDLAGASQGVLIFIAGGLISFIMLKVSVMLFTSLGGSLITVTGLLALLYQYDVRVSDPMTFYTYNLILTHAWFLPLAVIIPTIAGMLVQNKLIKHSPKWEI